MNDPIQKRGIMSCAVFEKREIPDMMVAANSGHLMAKQFAKIIGSWLSLRARDVRLQCATCEHVFEDSTHAEAFFIAFPIEGDGAPIVCGVCKNCVTKIGSEGLLGRAAEHFKRVWPNAIIKGDGLNNRG